MRRVGTQSERKGVVAARGERKRDLATLVVSLETRGGAGRDGFEEVVGTVELGLGQGVC